MTTPTTPTIPLVSNNKQLAATILAIVLSIVSLLGAYGVITPAQSTATQTLIEQLMQDMNLTYAQVSNALKVEVGSSLYGLAGPYSYMISHPLGDAAITAMKNGTTGAWDYWSPTNTSSVILNALGNGSNVYVQDGNYTLTKKIYVNSSNKHLIGQSSKVFFLSSLLPCFEIDGSNNSNAGGPHPGSGLATQYALSDIQMSNIQFVYTGSVTAGSFVVIHGLENELNWSGGCQFDNIIITSNQTTAPTNPLFIGLNFHDNVNVILNNLAVTYFGTGLQDKDVWQGDMISYNNAALSYCDYGYWSDTSAGGAQNRETWLDCKWIQDGTGYYSNYAPTIPVFKTPQFESIGNVAMNVTGLYLSVDNGVFSAFTNVAINTTYANTASITNCKFATGTTAIQDNSPNLHLSGNYYSSVTYRLDVTYYGSIVTDDRGAGRAAQFVDNPNYDPLLQNWGYNTTSASRSVTFPIGLAATPIFIGIEITNEGGASPGSWQLASVTAASATIYFDNVGTNIFDWYAICVLPVGYY